MNSFELFCEVLFDLLLRSLLFSRTFYLRFASFFIALSRGDLFILSLLCLFVNPFFCFLLFLHFISLFLSLFVHFALLLCSFDTKSDNCASLSCHFARSFLYFVLMIYSVWLRHSLLLTPHSSLILPFPPLILPLFAFSPMSLQNMVYLRQKT